MYTYIYKYFYNIINTLYYDVKWKVFVCLDVYY